MRVIVVGIIGVTEIKPISRKVGQRMLTLMLVDDGNIQGPQDCAQNPAVPWQPAVQCLIPSHGLVWLMVP